MTADARDDDAINALPVGTRFGELEILGTLGVGGFGIVYLARDHSLEREVAIKEYMPSQFAMRDGRSHVSVRSASMHETFELGRLSFVNEARLLARFDHPSLLKVYRFWEANGTAYMAMPRLVGHNLRVARHTQPTPPPEAWVRRIFDAVLGGLAVLHAQQVLHRDIAPDNIFLPADGGSPILLDFGAARQAIVDRTQVFTAILKPSFAPIEQYAEASTLRQGPWSDCYALAAVMHELLTGRPPPPATARAMGDELAPLRVPGYAPAFLAALDWALRVAPHQRPQTAAAWREVIDGHAPVPPVQPAQPGPARAASPAPAEPLDLEFADTVQVAPSQFDDPGAALGVPRHQGRPGWTWPVVLAGSAAAAVLVWVFVLQLRGQPAAAEQAVAEPVPSVASPAAAPAVEGVAPAGLAGTAASWPVDRVALPSPSASSAPARRAAAQPMLTEKAGEFRPVPNSPVFATTEQAATVDEACSGRVRFARAWCIDRQCERPAYQNDPECVKLREIRSSRSNAP